MKKIIIFLIKLVTILLPPTYMGLIWFLSSHPSDAIVNTGLSFDSTLKEGLHLVEFGILYLLLVMALISWDKLNKNSSFLAAFLSFFYGLTDELHQYFVPARSFSLIDLAKDLIGIIIVWYIVKRTFLKRLRLKNKQ